MSVCEENSCDNFQLAICLHCMRHLCVYHIVEHGNLFSKKIDDLKNRVNQIQIDINNASKTVIETSKADVRKCVNWRKQKLIEIDREYNKMMNPIRNQQKKLEELERRLTIRLKVEVEQPLENISTQSNPNPQVFDKIQLAIKAIQQDTELIVWNSLQLDETDIPNIKHSEPKKMKTWKPRNLFFDFFRDISPDSVNRINDFVQTMLEGEDKMENNGLITLVYSYLQTWHRTKQERGRYKLFILNKHILTIQRYVHGKDSQRKVLIALEVFFNELKHRGEIENNDQIFDMMTMLLDLFHDHKCISIPEMMDWYFNDKFIEKLIENNVDKNWAISFMNLHGCQIQPINSPLNETTNSSQTSSINIKNNLTTVKHVRIYKPYKQLAKLFKKQSDTTIHEYILNQFSKSHDGRVIMIVRCYLKAWFDSPLEQKNDVLLNNISIIQYYKYDQDFQIQILYAIEIFISKHKKDENWSIETISSLLQLFLHHNCIEKNMILKWNSDGPFYNDIYYKQTKHFAQSFIQQLIKSD